MVESLFETELRHAKAVARKVGDHILRPHYGNVTGKKRKEDGTFVCDQDLESSETILRWLRQYFPSYGILEEESGSDERGPNRLCWTVDPLDGTFKFVLGENPHYSVLIGLLYGYEAMLGVIYKPHLREMLWTIRGQGVYIEEGENSIPLRVSSSDELSLVCSASRYTPSLERIITELQIPADGVISLGGSAKFAEVAKGNVTLGYHPPENVTRLWDLVPIDLLVREAGGFFTYATGDNIDYSVANTVNSRGLAVASNADLHRRLVEAHMRISNLIGE